METLTDFRGRLRFICVILRNTTEASCSRGELSLHLNPVSKGFVAIIKGAISCKKYIQGYIVTQFQ